MAKGTSTHAICATVIPSDFTPFTIHPVAAPPPRETAVSRKFFAFYFFTTDHREQHLSCRFGNCILSDSPDHHKQNEDDQQKRETDQAKSV